VKCQPKCISCNAPLACTACLPGYVTPNCAANGQGASAPCLRLFNGNCVFCEKPLYPKNNRCVFGCSLLNEYCLGAQSIQAFYESQTGLCSDFALSTSLNTFCVPKYYISKQIVQLYFSTQAQPSIFGLTDWTNANFYEPVKGGSTSVTISLKYSLAFAFSTITVKLYL
jgi:hypothetical protein